MGLGTCYIGGARNHPDALADTLGLPERVFAIFGLTVGYPSTRREEVKPRYPQSGLLHRELYNTDFEPGVAGYDRTMEAFNGRQEGRQGRRWAEVSAKRVAASEALGDERPNLKEILAKRKMGVK